MLFLGLGPFEVRGLWRAINHSLRSDPENCFLVFSRVLSMSSVKSAASSADLSRASCRNAFASKQPWCFDCPGVWHSCWGSCPRSPFASPGVEARGVSLGWVRWDLSIVWIHAAKVIPSAKSAFSLFPRGNTWICFSRIEAATCTAPH